MQYCKLCKQMKPESEFYPISNSYVDKRVWCKACADEYRKDRSRTKAVETRRAYRFYNEHHKKQLIIPPLFKERGKRDI